MSYRTMFKQGSAKKKIIGVLSGIFFILVIWTAWGNTALELNPCTIRSDKLPGAFDGYRIAHISDLCTMRSSVRVINGFWICCGRLSQM